MANQLIKSIELLKASVGSRDVRRASDLLDAIIQYYDDQISDAQTGLGIERAFKENGGLLQFLKLSIKLNKLFKNPNTRIFQLFSSIIQKHKNKIIPYSVKIIETCINYINSLYTSSAEKEKAAFVIQDLIKYELCERVDRSQLLDDFLRIFYVKKPSGKLLQRIYELIGELAKDYPDCITEDQQAARIHDMYFRTLETTLLNQQEITYATLTGALNGFNYFLVNYGPSEAHKEEFVKRLYLCIKKLSDPPDNVRQRESFRSALNLLTEHCELFGDELLADCMYWHKLLLNRWMTNSWEDKKTAICLLHAFHREITKIVSRVQNEDSRNILDFFISYFRTTLESSGSQPYEIRIAIRGFGLMAGPCKLLLCSQNIDELLSLVMHRTENVAIIMSAENNDELEHFPDYIQALSQIMEHVSSLSGVQITTLQNIMIQLIRQFYLLSTAHHSLTVNSLVHTFFNLINLGDTVLDNVLEKVIFQGVIWTCSHKLPLDVERDWENEIDWKEQITFKSYLPLWLGLLADVERSLFDHSIIVQRVYDHLMNSLFLILDKLDLSTRKRIYPDARGTDQEYFFCDPNYDLEPVRPKDYHMFFNLVDFYRALLREQPFKNHRDHFTKWINQYFETIILKSIKYPLVSGFLKLLKTGFKIANSMDYFNNEMYEQNAEIYDNVVYYLKATISKVEQSSGELQLTCLSLLFTAPTDVLKDSITDMIPAFLISFDIGRNNMLLYIAEMALSAMERYVDAKPRTSDDLKKFLKTVLPSLDLYLQGCTNEPSAAVETVRKQGKRRVQRMPQITETELTKFQKRILLFLGKLEPDHCLFLVSSENKLDLVKWDVSKTICLTLYGTDFHPKIYLDEIMSRVCEIAINSTDRKSKVAACELVHGVILYLIGTDNHKGKLWSELCNRMLILGCDNDTVIRQMFDPLIMEVMHYMSQRQQLFRDGVVILLDCLMEAVSHPTNSLLRDLSARSLREFLKWTLKQSSMEEIDASPCNIQNLLEKLKLFSFDSQQPKRFGAALAFNNIYRLLREKDNIVNKHWLDLLNTFSINFMMCEKFGKRHTITNNNMIQVSASLDHLERVLREKKNIFNQVSVTRIKPVDFDGTLKDAVLWLLKQCSSTLTNYRRKMIELFTKLAICVNGFNSVGAFIRDTQSIEDILSLCENGAHGCGISIHPDLTHIKGSQSPLTKVNEWLESLLATLDCYTWLVGDGLVQDVQHLFKNCAIFNVTNYYLKNISDANIIRIISLIDPDISSDIDESIDLEYDIEQMEKINDIKCVILLRIYEFLIKVLPVGFKNIPSEFFESSKPLIAVIQQSLFRPTSLGFDLKHPDVTIKLPHRLESLMTVIYQHTPKEFRKAFNKELIKKLTHYYKSISDSVRPTLSANLVSGETFQKIKGIEICYRLSTKQRINFSHSTHIQEFLEITAAKVLYDIFHGLSEQIFEEFQTVDPPPDVRRYARHLLEVSLYKTNIYIELIDLILNTSDLKVRNAKVNIKHGKYFFQLFKEPILEYFLKEIEVIIERIVPRIKNQNIHYVVRILINLCEYAYRHKFSDKIFLKRMSNVLLHQWEFIVRKSSEELGIMRALIELMTYIAMICPFPLHEISKNANGFEEWLLKIITESRFQAELQYEAIFLLPCVVGVHHINHFNVEKAVETLQGRYFPLNSNEFREGSIEQYKYMNTFQSVLDALCTSKSPVLLKFVINCTAADEKHIMESEIQKAVEKFIKKLNVDEQCRCLEIPYQIFINGQMDPIVRLSILNRFLLIMLRTSSVIAIETFYKNHIQIIDGLCAANYRVCNGSWNLEHGLVSRTGGFELLELLFGIMDIGRLTSRHCPIGIKLLGASKVAHGREIISFVTKKAFDVRKEILRTENSLHLELFRRYQCAAYKTVCTIVNNTQTDLKLYERLIFIEAPSKNQFIWKHLINTSDNDLYTDFTHEAYENPRMKDIFVSIKNSSRSSDQPRKYVQTQNVLDSSLSQDITKIDLSLSSLRTPEEATAYKRSPEQNMYRIELNSINKHEVMASLCAVIEHMFDKKITPYSEKGVRQIAPNWVEHICDVIEDNRQPKNVRMFLAILIDNCRNWFRFYAPTVTRAILKILSSQCYGQTIDAFVIYMVVNLLDWHSWYRIRSIEETGLASDVIKILMENAYNPRKDVFKKNLELIKRLIEIWKDILFLPKQLLFEILRQNDKTSKESVCGIQINGIILGNGLDPWTDTTKIHYIRNLMILLENNYYEVYQPASQILGMALHQIIIIHQNNSYEMIDFVSNLETRLEIMRNSDEKRFTDILYGIHTHFEQIVDRFLSCIANYITCVTGALKRRYLEMFLSRVTIYEKDVYREVVTIRIKDLLKSNDYQLIALHIMNKILPKMTEAEIETIFPDICTFVDSKFSDCRDVMYEILIYIQKNFKHAENLFNTSSGLLLNGLVDNDKNIQNVIYNFWSKEAFLPAKLNDRIISIFRDLYSQMTEKHFLKYCSQLLLEPAVQSADSKQQILKHKNQSETKFKEYDINTSWRAQNSMMRAPLFMESQRKQFVNENIPFVQSYIQVTESNEEFEPTLDPSQLQPTSNSFSLQSQSSLIFDTQPSLLDRRSERIDPLISDFSKTLSGEGDNEHLRQRILRDKEQLSRTVALKAVERHTYGNVVQAQRQKHKESHVTLYRRYRVGDYPDLLINSLALLMPLKALAMYDAVLSKQIIVSIFQAICEELGPEQNSFIISMRSCFKMIFNNTVNCDSMLFSTLVEIAFSHARIFGIAPDILYKISNANNMMANGILLLESRLTENSYSINPFRESILSIDSQTLHWLKLANMYYRLSEYDIVAEIFSDKLSSDRRLTKAIECESNGDLLKAHHLYVDIIENASIGDNAPIESDFVYQSYYNCFVKMGRWRDLKGRIADQIEDKPEDLWADDWNKENLLPHYIRSELRMILNSSILDKTFFDNINAWIRDSERSNHIENNFSEELMMLFITNKNYQEARVAAEKHFLKFLSDWRNISVLSDKVRNSKILDIRRVAEIQKYTQLLSDSNVNRHIMNEFINRWCNTQMEVTDSVTMWESLVSYRRFICALTASSIDSDDAETSQLATKLTDCVFDMYFKLLDIALKQNNLELSKMIMSQTKHHIHTNSVNKRAVQWHIANCKFLQLTSQNLSSNESIGLILEAWDCVNDSIVKYNSILKTNPDIHISALERIPEISEFLIDMLPNINHLDRDVRTKIFECTNSSDKDDIYERIFENSYKCITDTIALAQKCVDSDNKLYATNFSSKYYGVGECYNKLAVFCQQYYENEHLQGLNGLEIERHIVVSMLRGMRHGSKEARLQFPRLLQLKNLDNLKLLGAFNEEVNSVPEWMFLGWLPQILSSFNFQSPCFLDNLLLRLSVSYPTALAYSFQLSYTQYRNKYPNSEDRFLVNQIRLNLRNDLLEKFMNSLGCLCLPEKVLVSNFTNISKSVKSNPNYTNPVYQKHLQNIIDTLFENPLQGGLVAKVKLFHGKIEALKRLNIGKDKKQILQEILGFLEQLREINTAPAKPTIESFCPWLDQYHWCMGDNYIELPGQYSGESRPNPATHAKIIRFGKEVEIYTSLRKPFKFSIFASNTKVYNFLVKYGEDLRQDQRIQQLLTLMTKKLHIDKNCREHNLMIQTYAVIPINSFCGMLSWVDNTESMNKFFMDAMSRHVENSNVVLDNIFEEYQNFISSPSKDLRKPVHIDEQYGFAASFYQPDTIAKHFEELGREIPTGILRNALIDISSSPECFFVLKNNFATSLAAMNIANWILGVGDRHLSNILLNNKNGKLVGIDYGMAFGAATLQLPIPELIPFRLTPHFVSVVSPMETSGLIKKCMVHALNAFRNNRKLLMACMEVFVNEPTIDWLESANRMNTINDETISSTDSVWEPKLRIANANKKLIGANPKDLTESDLKSGVQSRNPKYLEGYLKILAGSVNNVRRKLSSSDLSADQQVNCLIDIATDPAILGITFQGYRPWV